MADMLKGSTKVEAYFDGEKCYKPTTNFLVRLEDVRSATTSKSNLDHVKQDVHDILHSYYKVARKRFVDNVYHQAVDHYLLTGPGSPLFVFNQEWVIKLDPEQLEAIAGESPLVVEVRNVLQKKVDDLEFAMRILKF